LLKSVIEKSVEMENQCADARACGQDVNRERLEKARLGPANARIGAFTRLEAIG
jgi:hypothetical protein